MKTLTMLAAASVLALSAGAASAQTAWMSINQRQAALDARIDAGVRSGELTRQEAESLRTEYRNVAKLEANYRSNGLSTWERQDLDRRFDLLSSRIRVEANDRQDRNHNGGWTQNRGWTHNGVWTNINQRQAQLDQRIDIGVRTGKITRSEAYRLRSEYQSIARLEARYRVNGLSTWERADLDRRFDTLSARIRIEAKDYDRYGYGYRH